MRDVRKPARHHDIDVWQKNNDRLLSDTTRSRYESLILRNSSQQLRSDAHNKMHWNREQGTNVKLTDRIIDIERLSVQLDQALCTVDEEIVSVGEVKKATESANADKFPLNVACKRCLDVREARRDFELVDDFVTSALVLESQCLEKTAQQLCGQSTELWNNMCNLKEVRDKLKNDMKDKDTARAEDRNVRGMNLYSKDLTFKHMPLEIHPSAVTEAQWVDNSQSKKKDAETEVQRSQDLVCRAYSTIRQTDNNVLHHREKTQEAMRRRIHQVLTTRDVLQNQKQQLVEELGKLHKEVMELEKSMEGTKGPLKLVHTRLEKRKWYPPTETCIDGPSRALQEELEHIETYRMNLAQKMQITRTHYNELQIQLSRVDKDLEKKDTVLVLENRSLDIHRQPLIGEQEFKWIKQDSFPTSTESNMLSELSPMTSNEDSLCGDNEMTERRSRQKLRDTLTIGLRRNSAPSMQSFKDVYAQWQPGGNDAGRPTEVVLPDVVPAAEKAGVSVKNIPSSETFVRDHFGSALEICD